MSDPEEVEDPVPVELDVDSSESGDEVAAIVDDNADKDNFSIAMEVSPVQIQNPSSSSRPFSPPSPSPTQL